MFPQRGAIRVDASRPRATATGRGVVPTLGATEVRMTQAARQPSAPLVDAELSERDLELLEFERRWPDRQGSKEAAIRAELGLSSARYYQLLYTLIERPSALRHDPLLVRRLQRLRDSRVRARRSRTFGPGPTTTSQDETE